MTLKEFLEQVKDFPDDAEILLVDSEMGYFNTLESISFKKCFYYKTIFEDTWAWFIVGRDGKKIDLSKCKTADKILIT